MMRKTLCAIGLTCILVSSAEAQGDAWQHKWFWGAQAGVMEFKTNTGTGWQSAISAGGHWMITGARSALYVAFDQVLFTDNTFAAIADASSPTGIRNIQFNNGRRIQAQLYVVPSDSWMQFYLGGGFGIHQLTDASPVGTFATSQEQESVLRIIDQTATKAFPIFSGGLQLRFSRLALFGQYQYMPQGRNYLISSAQHVFTAGFRYAVTNSREEVTSRQ